MIISGPVSRLRRGKGSRGDPEQLSRRVRGQNSAPLIRLDGSASQPVLLGPREEKAGWLDRLSADIF